jgi:hypothetical protein
VPAKSDIARFLLHSAKKSNERPLVHLIPKWTSGSHPTLVHFETHRKPRDLRMWLYPGRVFTRPRKPTFLRPEAFGFDSALIPSLATRTS